MVRCHRATPWGYTRGAVPQVGDGEPHCWATPVDLCHGAREPRGRASGPVPWCQRATRPCQWSCAIAQCWRATWWGQQLMDLCHGLVPKSRAVLSCRWSCGTARCWRATGPGWWSCAMVQCCRTLRWGHADGSVPRLGAGEPRCGAMLVEPCHGSEPQSRAGGGVPRLGAREPRRGSTPAELRQGSVPESHGSTPAELRRGSVPAP